jgi:hypothetical protein
MMGYSTFKGRLIRMAEAYPIYDREDDNKVIGYTEVGDMAVITFEDSSSYDGGYYETVIVSGKYIGVDTLALNNSDIKKSTFIFNEIDRHEIVHINGKKVNFEFIKQGHVKCKECKFSRQIDRTKVPEKYFRDDCIVCECEDVVGDEPIVYLKEHYCSFGKVDDEC